MATRGDAVRIGVIGLGFFGMKHLAVLSNLPGVHVVGVCDDDQERARQACDRFGVERVFADATALATDPDVEAIHVVTPENRHAECVIPALESGKHVLCEKPLSLDTTEITGMQSAATGSGAFLMPGHILRFDQRYQRIRALIDRGELGRVVYANFRRFGNREIFPHVWSRAPGPYVASIHDVDLALWYLKDRPARVCGMSTAALDSDIPDSYAFLVEFASGSVATFETTCLPPPGSPFVIAGSSVYGTDGSAQVEHPSDALVTNLGGGPLKNDVFSWPEVGSSMAASDEEAPGGALEREIRYFTDCVRNGTPPTAVTATDAFAAVSLVQAAVKAVRSREVITIEQAADSKGTDNRS